MTEGQTRSKPRSTLTWVSTTYFAEGLPLWLVRNLGSVYLTDVGVRESVIGFLNFLNLPWNLKFLWAPAVDLWGTKRGWLIKVEALVAVLVALVGLLAAAGPDVAPPGFVLELDSGAGDVIRTILVVLAALAGAAATHDIAIDGYYMEAITDPREQAAYTGTRVLTYRLARFFTNGFLVALAGWTSWTWGWLGGAACLGALALFHAAYLPRVETPRAGGGDRGWRGSLVGWGRAFVSYLEQPRIGLILLFVFTYRLGDELLFSMQTPFLMRELGISKEDDLPWMAGFVGPFASIAGSMVSAWAIKRWGLRRAVWPLTLGMNLNIWAYVGLAWLAERTWVAGVAPLPEVSTVAAVYAYEQFAAGLGNAVLVVYIMRTCKVEYKASHYAVASAIASLGGTLFGGFGGVVVERVGYVWLYVLSFLAALPSMACLLVLKMPKDPPAADPT